MVRNHPVLGTLDANKNWDKPVQYHAVNRGEPDWVALRDALANDRVSTRLGTEPNAAAHQLLATANANSAVATGSFNITNNLSALRPAWEQAVGP